MLTILRGAPGAGKTTEAKRMLREGEVDAHFEADQWMVDDRGCYKFDRRRLSECHEACQKATREALAKGLRVVVANTFITRWEVEPYLLMGYPVKIITLTGRWPNAHGVPDSKVRKMRRSIERIEA